MSDANDLNNAAYVRYLRHKKRSEKTIQSYEYWLEDLAIWLDGADITGAIRPELEDYFIYLLGELADSSVAVAFRSLRAFFNWCVAEEIIDKSPMTRLSEPKVQDRPPDLAEDEELIALLKACSGRTFEDRRDTAMIRLFCEPGTPRLSEMAGQQLGDLDMRYNKIGFLGKGARWRTIPFGIKTGLAFDRYLRERTRHPMAHLPDLWIGQRGKALTPSGITQMLRRRCRQAGIRTVKPHQMRHTSAHWWKVNGGSEEDGEALFGWVPGSPMGRRYGRTARLSRAEKAARKMSPADRL